MRVAHEIYLHVVHQISNVDEAMDRLDEVMTRKPKFGPWVRVLMCMSTAPCLPNRLLYCASQHGREPISNTSQTVLHARVSHPSVSRAD